MKMAVDNVTILDNVWLNATNDFQQRIPQASQQGIAATMDALFDPMNRQYYNQFVDSLIMRIGLTYVHQQVFNNPLGAFKKASMRYGSTVQEMAVKWVKAHSYIDDAEDVFKMHRPDAAVWYHSQNRRDMYPTTVVPQELHSAFTSSDTGLNQFVASIFKAPRNADEYDEYRIMLQLLAFYEQNFGFYKHHLSGAPNDEATGKEFLKAVRTYVGKLAFPNTVYNGVRLPELPVFAKPNELVLLITPEINASVDVDTLAMLFNLERADIQVRKVLVDEFPIPNAVALLTTEDFFQCRDTAYETASIYNPKTLGTNYFLHHWGIYSVSPFVPAILFTTDAGTDTHTVTQKVTSLALTAEKNTASAGEVVQLTPKLTGTLTPADANVKVAPDACTYTLSGLVATGGAELQLPSTTYVDEYARLHLGKSLKAGNVVKVKATSTYVNPSGATTELTATATVTIQ
jgi:hypothetical protein